jgi:hypothetical protein
LDGVETPELISDAILNAITELEQGMVFEHARVDACIVWHCQRKFPAD